jgi:subtilase family serine protease
MDILRSLGPLLRQSSLRFNALPRPNSSIYNRIAVVFAAALAAVALVSAPAHAQAPDLAGGAAPNNVSSQLPAGYTGATPLEVMNGRAALVGHLPATQKLRVVLGLRPPHMAEEEAFLAQLQIKGSPNFHKYLTPQQWNARFAPSVADEQSVVAWAESQGLTVTQRYANRLIVDVEGTSDVIEKAFAVKLNQYKVGENVEFSNDRDPVVPAHLAGIIHSVGGLNSIQRAHAQHEGNIQNAPIYSELSTSPVGPSVHANGSKELYQAAMKAAQARKGTDNSLKLPAPGKNPDGTVSPNLTNGYIDPTDLYSSYGYDFGALQGQGHCCNPNGVAAGSPPETSIAIATSGDFANSDLSGFQAQYPYLAYNVSRSYIDGTPACCNDETTLDLEWSTATANSFGSYLATSHVFVYEGANAAISTFTDIFNTMLSDGNARIFTTSWGCAEIDCWSAANMDTDHAILNSMTGQGWTIMVASDDQGSMASCGSVMRVEYPASDPDAIAVGGTELLFNGDGTFNSEVAWAGAHFSGACSENDGGSGGGCSAHFAAPFYQSSTLGGSFCGTASRSVPDISLNAYYGENYFFNGSLSGAGGTSIAAPEVAGFMAQENAYLLAIGIGCGTGFLQTCAPIGEANNEIYYQAANPTGYATHYPFYDITSGGCNTNDDSDLHNQSGYCGVPGYDRITGWGSFNALQFAWMLSSHTAGSLVSPTVTFNGPPVTTSAYTWFNTDQTISWTVAAQQYTAYHYPAIGLAGYSVAWDTAFSDPSSETNQGTGNLFYSGPQNKNTTFTNTNSGTVSLSSAGQGCHYLTVYGEDNAGYVTGNSYYYWICYDNVAPTITDAISPSTTWTNQTVTVTLNSADAGGTASGVAHTYYGVNTFSCYPGNVAGCQVYTAPFTVSTPGQNYVYYWTVDNAGNVSAEPFQWVNIDEIAPVTTAVLAGTISSGTTYKSTVHIGLTTTDAGGSGLFHKYYQLDGGATTTYSGSPFTASALGSHTLKYWSKDLAGNVETAKTLSFSIVSPTTTVLTSSLNPSFVGQVVKLTATLTATIPGAPTPTGTVTFYNGSTSLGTAPLTAGVATFTTSSLPVGTLSLKATYPVTGNFLSSTSAVFSQTVHTPSSLTAPTPGSVLAGPSVTFTWGASTGASGYMLKLGTTVGGSDIYNSGTTTATTVTRSGLPTNGETIHARLTTEDGSTWSANDYTYTAATQSALTAPTPGSTLTGSTVTFTWSAAAGATGYSLVLGTTVGGSDIYNSGTTTATTVTRSGLPTNGETIHARLTTQYGAMWVHTDYTYTAQ